MKKMQNVIILCFVLCTVLLMLVSCHSSQRIENAKPKETPNICTLPTWSVSFSQEDEQFLDLLERSAFLFFWENTDVRGFTIESTAWPIGSIASTGFYLTSIPVAIERGWITYEEGRKRALTVLEAFYNDPEDPNDLFVENEHGFFPHWFDQITGKWVGVDCFSSIDTAILMAGVITVRQYFSGISADTSGTEEGRIVHIATELYEAVDWNWMCNGEGTLSMGWRPDSGFLTARWRGYNEGMLAVLLALGSPTHSIFTKQCRDEIHPWKEWTATYEKVIRKIDDQAYQFVESTSPALFTYQYPLIWFDLRGKKATEGVDYFENAQIATLYNRAYCIKNPEGHKDYGTRVWGLTCCECPLHPNNYGCHGPYPEMDDGTIAPTAVGGSIIFTPKESIEALRYMKETYGDRIWGKYGFKDSFNLDLDWFSPTYIGIDQGTILLMIENYRTGLIYSLFMESDYVKTAMRNAGFPDVDTTPPAITRVKKGNGKVTARITDNVGVKSATLHWDNSQKEMTSENPNYYSAEIPEGVSRYWIRAEDQSGNAASSRIYQFFETPWLVQEQSETQLPPDARAPALLVERFDGCIARKGAGAWHGGSSTPEDATIAFDSSVNHGETGCSLRIYYNVRKQGSYNGAWLKLGGIDLREYEELVFWAKGDEKQGFTSTFKIELKDSEGGVAQYTFKGLTSTWQRIAIPFLEFTTTPWTSEFRWGNVIELTIVFEELMVTNKEGIIYIDDIYFTRQSL